eukprot:7903110-Alexandrium_andersonii.AAC.1
MLRRYGAVLGQKYRPGGLRTWPPPWETAPADAGLAPAALAPPGTAAASSSSSSGAAPPPT